MLLGKLQPDLFPRVFGPKGEEALDADIVRAKFEGLAREVEAATGTAQTPEALAEGFVRIAVENMANAIRHVSVERGYDVSQYTLQCFGGAGGQHACLVADALGMRTVMIHPLAGVLSAYGIGLADERLIAERAVEATLDDEDAARGAARNSRHPMKAAPRQASWPCRSRIAIETRLREIRRYRHGAYRVVLSSPARRMRTRTRRQSSTVVTEGFETAYLQRFSFAMPERAAHRRGDQCRGDRAR